ncbi:MAG: UDP-N-acetylmuramoyl-tripeptide--D-alanyl-D-alanine ligase [Negativicutes bacterium]|nr:UDP-N-acetylmuramoyl-tripeptide--D-alanyl-D-alanine ligase [Negativicutes bacterium]
MIDWSDGQLREALAGNLLSCQIRDGEVRAGGVSTDSRTISGRPVFVALSGERFDGHNFIAAAVERGCPAVIAERAGEVPAAGANLYLVADSRRALQQLAAYRRRHLPGRVVAITGSNGKTSTKDITAALLATAGKTVKSSGNHNNEIGLPLTLLSAEADARFIVVEMGMRGIGQIALLAEIARPDVVVVTNVGENHLGLLGSIDNIAAAKAEIVINAPRATVVLNADDQRVAGMRCLACPGQPVLTFGQTSGADFQLVSAGWQNGSWQLTVRWQGRKSRLALPLLGRHSIANWQAAATAALALGLDWQQLAEGTAGCRTAGMRLEQRRLASSRYILDCYNASPASMRAAFAAVRDLSAGRRAAVLGDMLELGEASPCLHREVVTEAAGLFSPLIVLGEQMTRALAEAAVPGWRAADQQSAARILASGLDDGSLVLIKGSRGMAMEKVWQFRCRLAGREEKC